MDSEPGDEYIRRLATFVRDNEKSIAEGGFPRRRRANRPADSSSSLFHPLGWFSTDPSAPQPPKPVILSVDTHRLFYVLMRMEAQGFDVGTLDVQVDNPSRPMSYIDLFADTDKSDTISLASFRSSLSAVSGLSLGGGWWGRPEPPSVDSELRYLFSSFTKIPALCMNAPGRKAIAELLNESPNQNALPLDAFRNLQSLECVDIDPRTLLGWDRLSEGLRSLKIKKSGLEDIADIFIGAVIDDQARREGSTSRKRRRRIPHGQVLSRDTFFSTRLPNSVPEASDAEESGENDDEPVPSPPPPNELYSNKWAFLKHLSLPDNSLTFFPADVLPYLTSLVHLDLSSNLLVSVPPGIGLLHNLISLNLSDNMIDSVLGIYLNLGQVLSLNMSHNRLESICGLERLAALERVDLRGNLIEESAEIGRLAVLPNISDVWIEGNPVVEVEENYRVACFDYFWKEEKTIRLDGTLPGFYERRNLTVPPPEKMSSSRPTSTAAYSPPVVAVGHLHLHQSPAQASIDKYPTPPSSNASPSLGPIGAVGVGAKPRRKKVRRVVDLDTGERDREQSDGGSSTGATHSRDLSTASAAGSQLRPKAKKPFKDKQPKERGSPLSAPEQEPELEQPVVRKWGQIGTLDVDVYQKVPGSPEFAVVVDEPTPIDRISSTSTVVPAPSPQKAAAPTQARRTRHSHGRYQTEFIPASSTSEERDIPSSTSPRTPPSLRRNSGSVSGSATLSPRSGARRARVSASVYEPPPGASRGYGGGDALVDGNGNGEDIRDNGEAYRRRIEAMKREMGDGWLKVFSQSQLKSPSP
ncbi:hypothetical protein DXG03_006699 [Asterophora parasitica]|uniref:Leucine rich repeat domain-containing protein n=1 Tax=Asterophora parasitica TaxID=117018 RepID=A0A9P7KES9_9AGAR|nr:hypothetical protein DXG03_006699 [Asterophora parasitica]